MKKIIFKSTVLSIVAIIGILAACTKSVDPTTGSPMVSDFTPAGGGPVGTYVSISGLFFSDNKDNVTVTFGGVKATLISSSQANIITTVPTGAASGKIVVTVGGRSGSSAGDFAVSAGIPAPKITGTDVDKGSVANAATVKINGYNFSTTLANNTVTFAGPPVPPSTTPTAIPATVTAASANQLTVTVPAGAVTGKIKVSVTGAVGSATADNDFTVLNPTITSVTPNFSSVGSNVVLAGTDFSKTAANNVVKFNGVTATVVSVNGDGNSLIVTVPASATGPVSITSAGITTNGPEYFYQPVTVTGFQSDAASPVAITHAAIGTSIQITGTNFSTKADGNVVTFTGPNSTTINAKVTAATGTTVTAVVPEGAVAGKVGVKAGPLDVVKSATDFQIP